MSSDQPTEHSTGQLADGSMTGHQGSRDFLTEQSSLFQAPSWDEMLEIIKTVADLIEAVYGFFAEIALENPTGVTTELAIYVSNLLRAAIKLRDMLGSLADMQRPPPVGWPPAIRVQLDILHNRVDELWTGLELNKASSEALDSYRKGHGHSAIQIRPDWTGYEVVYASLLKAALILYAEVSHLARRATAATGSAPPAYRPDLAAKFLVLPSQFKATLISCNKLSLVRRTAAAPSDNGTATSTGRDIEAPAELPELMTLDQVPKYTRGKLDEHAVIELTKNPSLTYEQLAAMLGCRPGTLRDKRKCPLLVAAKTRIKATKQEFYNHDAWVDQRTDEE